MKEERDNLTLVYMHGFKYGRKNTKDEINYLREALLEIVEDCRSDIIALDRMIDQIEETARAAPEGEKKDE